MSWRETTVRPSSIAEIVLGAPAGAVLVLAGLDGMALRQLIEQVKPTPASPRALFTRVSRARTTDGAIGQLIDQLAGTARRLWPIWFTDIDFSQCGPDALGQLAAHAIIRRVAAQMPDLQSAWAEAAVDLVLDQKSPRVRSVPAAVEVSQLSLTVSRHGLVLIVDAGHACEDSHPAAVVHALEWVAQLTQCAVVALFRDLPPHQPPFDRILYGARIVVLDEKAGGEPPEVPASAEAVWLAPWLGSPHPLSETEQRLEKALRADNELARLFGCNQVIETVYGLRPKVDFVWTAGRMVVELDGYGSHGNRAAFMYDRHRDYELMMSGYTVLRLANDEIAQDIGKAVEKIRDIVHLCRKRMS
ncbi:endonuclease domain-containing protein [Bradyrhizobium sp.]|uniref:endonuclease domain-containing protein n=1 Tax=Bradyrhizobium sp. TaxID=376 RepID=UPI004037EA1C